MCFQETENFYKSWYPSFQMVAKFKLLQQIKLKILTFAHYK